ncbi:glycosyltransferase [Candidatus Poribacteria bacterium]|nr:glycosyltransferase [Candidatus Poribacteria bacterium]
MEITLIWIWFFSLLLSFLYGLTSLLLSIGVIRIKRLTGNNLSEDQLPFVSVLIPAKDEEKNIKSCLDSILNQSYPIDRYEIIVINDRSADNTPTIIRDYAKRYVRIKSLNIKTRPKGITGKQNALQKGLGLCSGEIILNTDADCIANYNWIREIVFLFNENTGIVLGFSTIHNLYEGRSFFANLQFLDILFLTDAAAGSIGLNIPVTWLGRNLSYKKSVLEYTDYNKMGYTITEDSSLIQAVARNTDLSMGVVYHKNASVSTVPEKDLKSFISQRLRWIIGGRTGKSWTLLPLYGIFLFHLWLMLGFLVSFSVNSLFLPLIISVAVKIIFDFAACYRVCKEFHKLYLLKIFIPYEIFMIIYSVILGFGSIFVRKVRWKNDLYAKN